MTTPMQVTPLAIEDYDAIEAAVMETARGRWFLSEYARRNRNADTDAILTGLERIERTIRRDRATPDIDRIRLDLADMAEAISRTKQEIARMKLDTGHGGRFADAGHELDAIVSQTEVATNDILLAAEGIQEAAWTLREAGADGGLCDRLDAHATEIYTACSFQDLTGQRTRKVVTVLRYLESRINAMMEIWGIDDAAAHAPAPEQPAPDTDDVRPDAHLLNGPQLHGRGIAQTTVDDIMWNDGETLEAASVVVGEPPVLAEPAIFDDDAAADDEEPLVLAEDPAADVFEAVAPSGAAVHLAAPLPDDLAAADVFAPLASEPHDEHLADVFASEPAADDVFAAAEPEPEAVATAEPEADVFASIEPEADIFETIEPAADIFEPVAAVAATPPAAVAAIPIRTTTIQVGNTMLSVRSIEAAEPEAEAAPTLSVIPADDPIDAIGAEGRLVAFG